jgi:hypothetical protein
MPAKPWKDWTDDELADAAQQGMYGQGAQVEAMRRLRTTIEVFSDSSDRYSRRMLWLTLAQNDPEVREKIGQRIRRSAK